MKARRFVGFSLLGVAGMLHAQECAIIPRESDAYREAKAAMTGHFPVELEGIEHCGVFGHSRLFTAIVETYQSYEGWSKSGELSCWQLSQHQPGEPYNCGRTIVSQHRHSGIRLTSKHDIHLPVIDEAALGLRRQLADSDEIQSMDYVPVPCGAAWSIDEYGFTLKLEPREPGVQRRFLAKKDCSPTPCIWSFEEIEPRRWQH